MKNPKKLTDYGIVGKESRTGTNDAEASFSNEGNFKYFHQSTYGDKGQKRWWKIKKQLDPTCISLELKRKRVSYYKLCAKHFIMTLINM